LIELDGRLAFLHMNKNRVFHLLYASATSLCAVASFFFWFLFYDLYWQHSGDFNAAGRYFDMMTGVVYGDQSRLLLIPTLGFLLLSILFARLWWQCRKKKIAGTTA
jgi:hypothetical protein